MDIAKYTHYFHDGYINSMEHIRNDLSISLESAVIDDISSIRDKSCISDTNSLKGTLKFYNIKKIVLDDKICGDIFHMQYDDGDILDFEIIGNIVFLLIEWKDFPPKNRKTDVSKIEIEAEKIEWIPDISTT